MAPKMQSNIRNLLFNLVNHRETNRVVTALLLFLFTYIALSALCDRNLFHPLENPLLIAEQQQTDNNPHLQANQSSNNIIHTLSYSTPLGPLTEPSLQPGTAEEYHQLLLSSIFSLFALWILALMAGHLLAYAYLPPLLGALLVGMAFANAAWLRHDWLVVLPEWDRRVQNIAFVVILMRCGLGINQETLRNSFLVCTLFGLISTTVEALALTMASHYFFSLPWRLSIPFSYVLTASSPAVIVPVLLKLETKRRGVGRGLPTVGMASTALDNVYCLTAFSIAVAVALSGEGKELGYILTKIPAELLIGAVLGMLVGLLLQHFPRHDAKLVHFTRGCLLLSTSMALYFGMQVVKCRVAGPIAVLLCCVVAGMQWKVDQSEHVFWEESALGVGWTLCAEPLLFALIGLLALDFSALTWQLLGRAAALLAIGLALRAAAMWVLSFVSRFSHGERCFASVMLAPKATMQAALAPLLIQLYEENELREKSEEEVVMRHTQTVYHACLLAILLTAPLGQMAMRLLGYKQLAKGAETAAAAGTTTTTKVSKKEDVVELLANDSRHYPQSQSQYATQLIPNAIPHGVIQPQPKSSQQQQQQQQFQGGKLWMPQQKRPAHLSGASGAFGLTPLPSPAYGEGMAIAVINGNSEERRRGSYDISLATSDGRQSTMMTTTPAAAVGNGPPLYRNVITSDSDNRLRLQVAPSIPTGGGASSATQLPIINNNYRGSGMESGASSTVGGGGNVVVVNPVSSTIARMEVHSRQPPPPPSLCSNSNNPENEVRHHHHHHAGDGGITDSDGQSKQQQLLLHDEPSQSGYRAWKERRLAGLGAGSSMGSLSMRSSAEVLDKIGGKRSS